MNPDKRHAHQLLDQLAPGELEVVTRLLEVLIAAGTGQENEIVSAATAADLDEAHAEFERGEGIPHEDILREFGLTPRS